MFHSINKHSKQNNQHYLTRALTRKKKMGSSKRNICVKHEIEFLKETIIKINNFFKF